MGRYEVRYAKLFPSTTGMPAKPLLAALGSLLIQKQYHYSERELVDQITENPDYQYYNGLPGYTMEPPFVPSLMVEFRKRLDDDVLSEINEIIIEYNKPDDSDSEGNIPVAATPMAAVAVIHRMSPKTRERSHWMRPVLLLISLIHRI